MRRFFLVTKKHRKQTNQNHLISFPWINFCPPTLISPQCSVARSLPAIPRCWLEQDPTPKIWAKNSKIDSCCLHPKGLGQCGKHVANFFKSTNFLLWISLPPNIYELIDFLKDMFEKNIFNLRETNPNGWPGVRLR